MKSPIPAKDTGLSGKLVLIGITVTVAAGAFILGYFVGKTVSTGSLVQQVLPRPAIGEHSAPTNEARKVERVVPVTPEQKTKKEGESPAANQKVGNEPVKPSGPGQSSGTGEKLLAAQESRSDKETGQKPVEETAREDLQSENIGTSHAASYTVQVGAFKSRREADALQTGLEAKGYKTQNRKTGSKGKPLYKVVVGEFGTKKEAELLALKLRKAEGLHSFVVPGN